MEYLLDTHSFLWFVKGDGQLSERAGRMIADPDTVKYVSIVSFLEIAIKISIGKLKPNLTFQDLGQQIAINGFCILPVTFEHSFELANLDFHHKDPLDRMIIAQTLTENLTLISKDRSIEKYKNLQLLW